MYGRALLVLCAFFILHTADAGLLQKNKISFDRIEFTASDPSVLFIQLNAREKSESEQEISGYAFFSEAVDTETFDNFKVNSSPDPAECKEMKPMPLLTLPQKDTRGFMNDIYKPFMMEDMKSCSDMPVFQGDWGDQSLAGNYTFDKCILKTDSMQPVFSKGYYCLFAPIKRDMEPKFEGELRVYLTSA